MAVAVEICRSSFVATVCSLYRRYLESESQLQQKSASPKSTPVEGASDGESVMPSASVADEVRRRREIVYHAVQRRLQSSGASVPPR